MRFAEEGKHRKEKIGGKEKIETYAKKAFPRTFFKHINSNLVGRSVSTPSSPKCL